MILVIPGFEKKSVGLQVPTAKKQRFLGESSLAPFQCLIDSEISSGTQVQHYLSVVWGTVGGVTPTLDGLPLYAMPSNGGAGFLPRPRVAVSLPADASSEPLVVYLSATVVGGSVTEASIETASGMSTIPADTDGEAHLILASINFEGTVSQATTGSKGYVSAWKGQLDPSASSYIVHRFFN